MVTALRRHHVINASVAPKTIASNANTINFSVRYGRCVACVEDMEKFNFDICVTLEHRAPMICYVAAAVPANGQTRS
jgi:predicted N-acyltransferase